MLFRSALAASSLADKRLAELGGLLRANPAELGERVGQLLDDRKRLERQVTELQRKLAVSAPGAVTEAIGPFNFQAQLMADLPGRELKAIAETLAKQMGSGVVAVVSTAEAKVGAAIAVTADLMDRVDAVALVKAASAAVGGKGGGGKPDLAQGGGPDIAAVEQAFEAVRTLLREAASS